MPGIYLLFLLCFTSESLWSQGYDRFNRKEFEVVHHQKNTTSLNMNSEAVLFYSDRTIATHYAVSDIYPNGYRLLANTTAVQGKLIAFGQEQLFDSRNLSALPAADSTLIHALLHSTSEIIVKNNTSSHQSGAINSSFFLQEEDTRKFFLALPTVVIRQGYSWSDSTHTDSSKNVSEYMVIKKTADTIQVMVYSLLNQQTLVLQKDQQMVQQLKGYSTSMRWYNTSTGMLLKEESSIAYNGSSEINGQRFPVSITITAASLLSEVKR